MVIAADYLAAGLALMDRIEPTPHDELSTGYTALGGALSTLQQRKYAAAALRQAINHVDTLLETHEGDAAENEILTHWRSRRSTLLNNIGWSLLTDGQFAEAVAPLEAAYKHSITVALSDGF
jgi:hypothetical protein